MDKLIDRFEQECAEWFAEMREDHPSVGDALFVAYEPKFCNKHGVDEFGRMTVSDNKFVYHASPSARPVYTKYDYDGRNFIDYFTEYASGKNPQVPVEKFMARPRPPKRIEGDEWNPIYYTEKALFLRMAQDGEFVIVNPSWSTLYRAAKHKCAIVVKADSDLEWVKALQQAVKEMPGDTVRFILPHEVGDRRCYLGSNRPEELKHTFKKWCTLIPDPYRISSLFNEHTVTERKDGVLMTYSKKNKDKKVHHSKAFLPDEPLGHLHSPSAVFKFLRMTSNNHYFMEDDGWCDAEGDSAIVPHAPSFISSLGTWVTIGQEKWMVKGKEVVDVHAVGTYLSRRSHPPPAGYSWMALSSTGLVPFTRYTYQLKRDVSLHNESMQLSAKNKNTQVVTFHSAKKVCVIRDAVDVRLTNVWFVRGKYAWNHCGAVPVKTICGMFGYFVSSGTFPPLDFERVAHIKYSEQERMVWLDSDQFMHGSLYRVDPNGTFVTPGAPRGEIRTFPIVPSYGYVYVLLRYVPQGYAVAFPTSKDLTSYFALSAVRYDNWSLNSAARPVDDALNYQSRSAPNDRTRVNSILTYDILSWGDTGVTSAELQRNLVENPSMVKLSSMLRRDPAFLLWKMAANEHSIEWIRTDSCKVVIGGPSNYGISKMTVAEWYDRFLTETKSRFTYDPGNYNHFRFVQLLQQNYCHVVEDHTGPLSVCRVRNMF